MATAAVDEEECALMCALCLDSYKDPCTLQCKHSFCRRCITDYVKTEADAIQNRMIPCPSCRQVTKVPDPSRQVDEWAGQLQPRHITNEHIARVNKNVEDSPCSPCQQIGETTPGKFWCAECEVAYCQRCSKTHSVMPNNHDHDVCDLKDKGQVSRRKARCKEHKDQLLQLYCKNCNVSHCQLCFVDHHRKCEDVVTVKSIMSDMKTELSEVNHQLEEQEKKSNNLVELQKTMISQLNSDKISVIDEIRCASRKAVDMIKMKEKQLVDQFEEITNRETNELKSKVKQGNIQMQTNRQYCEYIKQAVSSDSEVEVCDVYQVWKSGQLDISQEGDEAIGRWNISSVRFSQQKHSITEVLDSLPLGEIVTTYLPTDVLSSPVLSECVDTRGEQDEEDPGIHDITVLEVEGVHTAVVTDHYNKGVKSFYTRNNTTCHSRLQLDSGPWGITQLGDNKVMVAVPKKIVTVAVTPDLVYKTCISTSRKYYSLAMMSPSRLAAGSYKYVDILNMQGEVMKSVTTHNNMELFKNSDFMCISKTGHLLVSDFGKETVTCLTSDGQTVWIYSGTGEGKHSNPRGITTTGGGDILVVDRILKKVIQLSESGEYVRDVLTSQDGLSTPRGICLDNHGSLYVSDSGRVMRFTFVRQ